jgi:iron transport multicopper oxidase
MLYMASGQCCAHSAEQRRKLTCKHRISYRLRLVSISCEPAYKFSVDRHSLTIIEVDGINVKPLEVDSLQIFAGQRYSVVLNANQPIKNYWIRALPNYPVQDYSNYTNVAILRYSSAPISSPQGDPNKDVPQRNNPLKETNLHVSPRCDSPMNATDRLHV